MLASESRQIFAQIERMLSSCPAARHVRGVRSLSVPASGPDGFDIVLALDQSECILCLDGWSLEFNRPEQALEYVELALCGDLRLRINSLAGRPWRWTLERLALDRSWKVENVMGYLRLRFWGEKRVIYLRNDFGFTGWSSTARHPVAPGARIVRCTPQAQPDAGFSS